MFGHFFQREFEQDERNLFYFVAIALFFTLCQFLWLYQRISLKVGIINILPTFIYLLGWICYCHSFFNNCLITWIAFLIGFSLTLRLPLTVANSWELPNWILVILFALFLFLPIGRYFSTRRRSLILLCTTVIVLFHSYSHIWLNSPFTYTFRLVNHLESNYTGVDNNTTWECPYEQPTIVVHCDMRHFIASEKIFTDPEYDPSFSVFLRRFFYGYLSSLVGYEGHRWFASFSINIFAWLIACVCIFRICILLNLKEEIAGIAMLTCASAWGFVSFVGQPAPYLLAYALSIVLPWSTLEIIKDKKTNSSRNLFLSTIFLTGLLVYDLYPVFIICTFIFLFNKAYSYGINLTTLQVLLSLSWSKFLMPQVLGTEGNLRNSQVISKSFTGWISALYSYDLSSMGTYIKNGILSFIIASFGIGFLALATFLGMLCLNYTDLEIWNDRDHINYARRNTFTYFLGLSLLTLLASIFLAPEALFWNPSNGLLPRFNFYYFSPVIISATCLLYNYGKRISYCLPALCFVLPLLDSIGGIATVPLLFDYGQFRLVWK